MRRQSGFTLLELGIALVIIGIMSMAVMKTDSLIRAARVTSAVTLYSDVSEAIRLFRGNYQQWPGDMSVAGTTLDAAVRSECKSGDGKGTLDGAARTAGGTSIETESMCVPEMLVKAGIGKADTITVLNGATAEEWLAFTTSYGPVWVRDRSKSRAIPTDDTEKKGFAAASRFVLEFEALPCQVAAEIDMKLDNGGLTIRNGKGEVEWQKGIVAAKEDCYQSDGSFVPDNTAAVYAIGL